MSANNCLQIKFIKPSYFVIDKDIESHSGYPVGNAKTLEEAVRIANKYMEDGNIVEYGLEIVL